MANGKDYIGLVNKAQRGDKESLSRLCELSGNYLRTYIYRLTLDGNLTEDIVQDSLLELVQSIGKLKKAASFYSWLRVMAVNKMYSRLKKEKRHKAISLSDDEDKYIQIAADYEGEDNMSGLESKEWKQIILDTMRLLKPRQRQVLVLRCYESMEYSEIAQEMGCTQFNARVLFYRAKNALKKKLRRRGLQKGMLLSALVLFGRITSRSEAEIISVSAPAIEVGFSASVVGSLLTKLGISVTAALTALVLSLVTVTTTGNIDNVLSLFGAGGSPLRRSDVRSFYYMEQNWGATGQFNRNLMRGRSLSRGAYEQWFYFPEGVDGPMFMMMQRWDPQRKERLCGWLQNSEGNFYYSSGANTIYINNYNLPLLGLQTRRLPTDTQQFTEFLDGVEGEIPGVNYYRDSKTGLLTGVLDSRFYNVDSYEYNIVYNTLEKTTFDSFRYPWPQDADVVDERDQMHKRRWTYFTVSGRIDNLVIDGKGRIPFVYDAIFENKPWLHLDIAGRLQIVDCPWGAYTVADNGEIMTVCPAGSFFKGLSRPWMGMHTADLIRRDAVKRQISFSLEKLDYNPSESRYERAVITMFTDTAKSRPVMRYFIDVTTDVVDRIEFLSDSGEVKGRLDFTYYQDIEKIEDEFAEPEKFKLPKRKKSNEPGIEWLIRLSEGTIE